MCSPFLTDTVAYGPNQFAYAKGRGARDALALLTLTWLAAFDRGEKIMMYCSDVSGAFDKVCRKRLVQRLLAQGLHPDLAEILGSWLEERRATVLVNGA